MERTYFKKTPITLAPRIYPWIDCDVGKEIVRLGERLELSLREVSMKFARVKLETQRWC